MFETNMMFLTFQTISTIKTIETILTKNVRVRLCASVAILIGYIYSIHNSEFNLIPPSLRGVGPYGPYGPEAAFQSFRIPSGAASSP
jgi:hypothetical protein